VAVKLKYIPALILLVAATCAESTGIDVIGAKNDSPERQDVDVFYLSGDDEQLLVRIEPGSSVALESSITRQCTQGALIARYPDGEEVERRAPGVCVGTIWLINGNGAD
jgi:hypothetical protein